MIELNLHTAAEALQAELQGDGETIFSGVSIDSRTLIPGNLFVAIKGEKFDGHDYIGQVEEAGAIALLVHRPVKSYLPQIIVKDTFQALGQLAGFWRSRFKTPVVGITGSAGKTTTKQMLGAILSQAGNTLIPEGNKNNYYGVPLTLFRLSMDHAYAVIEMGADRPGEISYLTNIVRPDVAIITNVAAVHLQVEEGVGFGSVEGVFKEKSEIFSLLPENGVAVINADDHFFPAWEKNLKAKRRISFGLQHPADVYAVHLEPNSEMRYNFDLATPMGHTNLTLSSLGKHNVMNALAASSAAIALGIPLEDIKAGLEAVATVEKRLIRYPGKKGALIIDDSYNANVKSVPAVMEMLANFPGRRIMIFGDMLQLGATSLEEHAKVGELAKQLGLNYFFAYGPDSQAAVQSFGEHAAHFDAHEDLVEAVLPLLNTDTVVVVKGSRGMKMENVVKGLRNEA